MNISLITIGKTDLSYIIEGVEIYFKRINRYTRFNIITIADIKNSKNLPEEVQKVGEGELILSNISTSDYLVLLDEAGKQYTSVELALWTQKKMNAGIKRLVFVIGGPYGFSQYVYKRADEKISLSKMTFSHQMVRLIFTEQLYRAFSIINGEPYHHQ
ncbi:MAG: 23S rRNA (pseudouridine(1915)-N(3))-methyltransferase RlmH [Rikenellaceae bacterium]|nr:23S rRNA (pseudouridine(1915)-N(3))-methyltransferase RlmH [Rikenellaceae bacterium]